MFNLNPAMLLQMLTGQVAPLVGDISGLGGASATPAAGQPSTPYQVPSVIAEATQQAMMPPQPGTIEEKSLTPPWMGPARFLAGLGMAMRNPQAAAAYQMMQEQTASNLMGSALMQMLSGNQQQAPKKEGENGGPFPQQPPQAVMSNQQQLAKVLAGSPAALQMLSPDSLLQAWGVAEAMDRSLTSAAQQAFQNKMAEQGLALETISTADRLATGDVSRKATLQDMDLAEKREGRDEKEHTKRMAAFNQSFEANQRALDDQIRQSEQQLAIEKIYASIAGMPYEEGEARARLQTQRNLKTGSPEDAAKMVDRVAMYIDVYLNAHKDLDDPALRQLQQDISLDVPQTNEFMLMSPEEQAQALRARKLNMTSYIERMKTHPVVQQAVALAKAEIDAGAEPNAASMAEMRNLTLQTQTAAAGTSTEETTKSSLPPEVQQARDEAFNNLKARGQMNKGSFDMPASSAKRTPSHYTKELQRLQNLKLSDTAESADVKRKMIQKLMEEAASQGYTFKDGVFYPPAAKAKPVTRTDYEQRMGGM